MIQVNELSRHYDDIVAVDHISFEIPRGQIVGLLGHNGAGKSTTLKMLTGFLEPTTGVVQLDGEDIATDLSGAQRRIGYLPESAPLYPEMTVYESLCFAAELHGMDATTRDAAIARAMQRTQLTERTHQQIDTLSKGFKQRVGVAQAILHDPDIIVMDEPTNGLDPTQILEMRKLIKELSTHATVILSTHILQEVQAICDRVIIIMQGRIAEDALLADLQSGNHIAIAIDQADAEEALQQFEAIRAVTPLGLSQGVQRYELLTDGDVQAVAPQVAASIIAQGWKLYQLQSEQRDLESVFNALNSTTLGGEDA